ncbi:hypothetical protein IscW_ISCW023047, partial [Ixodes scapularis]
FYAAASAEKPVTLFWENEGVILTYCFPKGTTAAAASFRGIIGRKRKCLPGFRGNTKETGRSCDLTPFLRLVLRKRRPFCYRLR